MKKIFNICLLLAVTAGFVACSDDNDAGSNYLRENPVQVVNSKLTFTAAAQKGGVKFMLAQPFLSVIHGQQHSCRTILS